MRFQLRPGRLIAMAVALCAISCTSNYTPTGPTQTSNVSIVDFAFSPTSIAVPVGTTVTWKNNGAVAHTSTSDAAGWNSGSIAPGASFTHTFTSAGTFTYHCTIHPNMTATVTVQ